MKKTNTNATTRKFLTEEMLTTLPVRVEIDGKPYDMRVSEAVDLLNASNEQAEKIAIISLLYTYTIVNDKISKQANY